MTDKREVVENRWVRVTVTADIGGTGRTGLEVATRGAGLTVYLSARSAVDVAEALLDLTPGARGLFAVRCDQAARGGTP